MPVFNAEKFLRAAIDSILGQTWSDFEFVIIDDGSTDGTGEILRKYEQEDPRVRLVFCEHVGVTNALNEGLAVSRGEYVARMDADDVSMPERFAVQVDYLDEHPEVVAVGSAIETMDTEGAALGFSRWAETHEEIDRLLLRGQGGLAHPSAMIRLEALKAIGGYRPEFRYAQDKDLWLRLAEHGRLANLPLPLLRYREHAGSIGFAHRDEQSEALRRAVHDAYMRRGLAEPGEAVIRVPARLSLGEQHRRWLKTAVRAGNFGTAFKYARRLLSDEPFSFRTWMALTRLLLSPAAWIRLRLRGRWRRRGKSG
jgi:cellulose synthase/poly-beta-1,6-N-acetylglucosamine synthase-like glycosyltransferase